MKFVLTIFILLRLYNADSFKLIIKTIVPCDANEDYNYILNLLPTQEGDKQFISGNLTLKVPLTDDVSLNVLVKMIVNKKYRRIINITEKQGCNAVHKLLGEFVYDLERNTGLTPGICPIPKGVYRLNHHEINTNKITLQSFPLGDLQFISTFTHQGKVLSCIIIEVDNV